MSLKEKKKIGGSVRGSHARAVSRVSLDLLARQILEANTKPKKEKVKEKEKPETLTKVSVPSAEVVHENGTIEKNGTYAASSDDLLPATMKVTATAPTEDVADQGDEVVPPETKEKRKALTPEGWDFFNSRYPEGLTRKSAAAQLGVRPHELELRPRRYYALLASFDYLVEKMGRQLGPKDVAVVVDFVKDAESGKYNPCTCSNADCKARFFEIRFADVLHPENREFREVFERLCRAGSDVDLALCARVGGLRYRGPRYKNPTYDKNAPATDKDKSRRWLTFCGAPFIWDNEIKQIVFDEHSCLGSWGLGMADLEEKKTNVECEFYYGLTLERVKRVDKFEAHNDQFDARRKGGILKLLREKGQGVLTAMNGREQRK